jgi:hypothetical protein
MYPRIYNLIKTFNIWRNVEAACCPGIDFACVYINLINKCLGIIVIGRRKQKNNGVYKK